MIIENQLEKSDHDHLGKLITYLTAYSAKSAIWINSYPRPEHVKAINWLNESTNASFYLFKLEAIQIGESERAPLLTLIAGKDQDKIESKNDNIPERDKIRYEFWEELLKSAKGKTDLHANISPQSSSYVSASAGKAGLYYQYDILMHAAKVELYIDFGNRYRRKNKRIFDDLFENKTKIEADFGAELEWQRLEDKRACRIMKTLEKDGGYREDKAEWPKIQDAMINSMIGLEKALRPYIDELRI